MKTLLASTAMVLAGLGSALADGHQTSPFLDRIDAGALRASDLIGAPLHVEASETDPIIDDQDGWSEVGEISDVIVGPKGGIDAVVADIGGFLGLGDKNVAIDMESLRFVMDDNAADTVFIVLRSDRTALETAPVFDNDFPSGRTAGAIAVDNEGGGMTTAASPNIVTTREGAPQTGMGDQTFEGSDTDVADLDDGTVVDNDQTPATAVVQGGQVETPTGDAAPSLANADTDMAEGDPSTTLVTDIEMTALADGSDLRAPAITRDGFQTVDRADLPAEFVVAMPVYDTGNARIGNVEEVMIDPNGRLAGAVVDMGSMMGPDKRPVILSMDAITILQSGDDFRAYIDATSEQLDGLPRYGG